MAEADGEISVPFDADPSPKEKEQQDPFSLFRLSGPSMPRLASLVGQASETPDAPFSVSFGTAFAFEGPAPFDFDGEASPYQSAFSMHQQLGLNVNIEIPRGLQSPNCGFEYPGGNPFFKLQPPYEYDRQGKLCYRCFYMNYGADGRLEQHTWLSRPSPDGRLPGICAWSGSPPKSFHDWARYYGSRQQSAPFRDAQSFS